MTPQRYMLWRCNGHLRARCGGEIVKVRWNPGREEQFYSMINRWAEQDAPPSAVRETEQPDANKNG